MKKAIIIIVAVLVVAAGGFAIYKVTQKDDKPASSTSDTQTQQSQSEGPVFNPAAVDDLEFTATVTTTSNGKTAKGTLKFDGQGNSEYNTTVHGQKSYIFMTKDAYYTCSGSTSNCIKLPISQAENAGVDPQEYEYNQEDINAWKSNATYKGQEACGNSTCDIWETTVEGQGTTTIYIDTNTHYIMKVTSVIDGTTSTIEYDYVDVTITLPKNAKTAPSLPTN